MSGRAICHCGEHGIRVEDPGYHFPFCGICGKNWPVQRSLTAVVVETPADPPQLPPMTAIEADVLGDDDGGS